MYRECAWCLSNMAVGGSKDQVEKLCYYDGIKAFAKQLNTSYPDNINTRVCLEGLKNIYEVSFYFIL